MAADSGQGGRNYEIINRPHRRLLDLYLDYLFLLLIELSGNYDYFCCLDTITSILVAVWL
jgi:hypothetical protein